MARGVRPQTPVATLLSAVGAFPRPFKGRSPRAVFMGRPSARGATQRACGANAGAEGQVAALCAARSPLILSQGDSGLEPVCNRQKARYRPLNWCDMWFGR